MMLYFGLWHLGRVSCYVLKNVIWCNVMLFSEGRTPLTMIFWKIGSMAKYDGRKWFDNLHWQLYPLECPTVTHHAYNRGARNILESHLFRSRLKISVIRCPNTYPNPIYFFILWKIRILIFTWFWSHVNIVVFERHCFDHFQHIWKVWTSKTTFYNDQPRYNFN